MGGMGTNCHRGGRQVSVDLFFLFSPVFWGRDNCSVFHCYVRVYKQCRSKILLWRFVDARARTHGRHISFQPEQQRGWRQNPREILNIWICQTKDEMFTCYQCCCYHACFDLKHLILYWIPGMNDNAPIVIIHQGERGNAQAWPLEWSGERRSAIVLSLKLFRCHIIHTPTLLCVCLCFSGWIPVGSMYVALFSTKYFLVQLTKRCDILQISERNRWA